jgi:hypothetical protein
VTGPTLGDTLTGIVGLPVAVWLTSLGVGLAAERVIGLRLHNALVICLGTCAIIVLSLPLYALGSSDVWPLVVMIVLGVAGLAFARDGWRARLNPGAPGIAALGVYLLYMLPVIATGHWTWIGYNFVNDTSVQMELADHLKVAGTHMVLPVTNTAGASVDNYLGSQYPLGSHAYLADLSGLLRTGVDVLYQGYLSALAAIAALGISAAVSSRLGPRRAICLGFAAATAYLTLQYAFQGNVKELGTMATSVSAVALGAEAIRQRRPYAGAALVAFPLGATLCCYYAAGVPYVAAMAAGLAAWMLVGERRRPNWRWIGPAVFAAALTALLSIPALSVVSQSYHVLHTVLNSSTPSGPMLGQLARPLPLSEISGVWLNGNYLLPIVAQPAGTLTAIATGVIFVLMIPGVVHSVVKREPAGWLAFVMTGLVLLEVHHRVSPYAGAKLLAIGSPTIVWVAGLGLTWVSGRWLLRAASAIGAALIFAVLVGDVLAYHHDQIAPTKRMIAMQDAADHFRSSGPVLFWESDEFVKFFTRHAAADAPFEAFTPMQAQLRQPLSIFDEYYDIDDATLPFVESYPVIVMRRGPADSRLPANFSLAYENEYYEGWVRHPTPQVINHLPLQSEFDATAPASCPAVQAMVAAAPKGSELMVSQLPPSVGYDVLTAKSRPYGWAAWPSPPGTVIPLGPGNEDERVDVPATGRYAVWVQGSFPRPVAVDVNGRRVGSVSGMDSVNQWAKAGTVTLTKGGHSVRLHRGGGRFGPGDGAFGEIGYVDLTQQAPARMYPLPLDRWHSLCGRTLDWIEVVRP